MTRCLGTYTNGPEALVPSPNVCSNYNHKACSSFASNSCERPGFRSSLRCSSVYSFHCNPKRKEFPFLLMSSEKLIQAGEGGFSFGANLGLPRTSVALAKAFVLSSDFNGWLFSLWSMKCLFMRHRCSLVNLAVRLVTSNVLELWGQKLELRVLDIAENEEGMNPSLGFLYLLMEKRLLCLINFVESPED